MIGVSSTLNRMEAPSGDAANRSKARYTPMPGEGPTAAAATAPRPPPLLFGRWRVRPRDAVAQAT
jgi:hypothetical protein